MGEWQATELSFQSFFSCLKKRIFPSISFAARYTSDLRCATTPVPLENAVVNTDSFPFTAFGPGATHWVCPSLRMTNACFTHRLHFARLTHRPSLAHYNETVFEYDNSTGRVYPPARQTIHRDYLTTYLQTNTKHALRTLPTLTGNSFASLIVIQTLFASLIKEPFLYPYG